MMSVTQESVKLAFCMQIPRVCRSQGKFTYIFCNKLPFWRPFCLHSYFFFFNLLEAKCLQLDSNFIAYNLREKVGLRHFSLSDNVFTYNWPLSWTPSWIYRNAQWCQSGITRIFQRQCMHYQNQQRKKFKIKFQVLLKFAQILPDYYVASLLFHLTMDHVLC